MLVDPVRLIFWVFCVAVVLPGCADTYKKEEAQAQKMPVNCAVAEGDLRVLKREKANTGQEIAQGVSMIVPIGLVVGLVSGTEKTKYQVATGEYDKMLDKKIAEIQTTCHVK